MPPAATFLVIGNPENRRVQGFADAARAAGADVRCLAWAAIASSPLDALGALPPHAPTHVRVESFGEHAEVERLLLRRGLAAPTPFPRRAVLSEREIDALPADRGRVLAPRQAHDGWLAVLGDLEAALAARPAWRCWQPIAAIRTLFDKPATHRLAASLGVPVPAALPSCDTTNALVAALDSASAPRAYVKLGCGSSASCIALLERTRAATSVVTTLEVTGDRLYNSRRVKRYARPALVDRVLDFLLAEGAHVEIALDKAPSHGLHADVRLLFVGEAPLFAVLRTSVTPITNLHLGGKRGDLEGYRKALPPDAWPAAERAGRALARALGTWHLGVDIAFERRTRAPFVLEGNAFGDLLPGVSYEGQSVYEREVRAVLTADGGGTLMPR